MSMRTFFVFGSTGGIPEGTARSSELIFSSFCLKIYLFDLMPQYWRPGQHDLYIIQ